jgi:hypothetical protein
MYSTYLRLDKKKERARVNKMQVQYLDKTGKSKTSYSLFGEGVLTDKKMPPLFLGQFLFRLIIFVDFVFSFSLFQGIGSENAARESWGVDLVNSLPKVHSKDC